MSETDLELLNETLIDNLFDIFDKNLGNIYSQEFINKLNEYFEKENITIEFIKKDVPAISGKALQLTDNKGYKIKIFIPLNVDDSYEYSEKIVLRTIIHEITHILTEYKIPDFAIIKFPGSIFNTYQRFSTKNIKNHTYNVLTYKLSDLEKYLEYVLHIREKSSFATSVALSCYFDLAGPKRNPKDLFNSNFQVIKEYLNNQISYYTITRHMSQIDGDALELFLIQFAVAALRKNGKIYKIYQYQMNHFLKLCIKYWNRLNKLFGE